MVYGRSGQWTVARGIGILPAVAGAARPCAVMARVEAEIDESGDGGDYTYEKKVR